MYTRTWGLASFKILAICLHLVRWGPGPYFYITWYQLIRKAPKKFNTSFLCSYSQNSSMQDPCVPGEANESQCHGCRSEVPAQEHVSAAWGCQGTDGEACKDGCCA